MSTSDITAVYYSADTAPPEFVKVTHHTLLNALGAIPIVEVHLDDPAKRSHFQIYRQALQGAKQATTKYIALCEDDVLYSPDHFKYRPSPGKFAYNLAAWSIFTWTDPPMFTHKGTVRKNLNSLICERELFIEAMEERFQKYPNDEADKNVWAEPGRYENKLGVTVRETEDFYTAIPNIVFSHPTELSYAGLGKRKRVGEFRALEIPHWGKASDIVRIYDNR